MADAMDSKSISREGVGVQVPASAPTSTARSSAGVDELFAPLVAVLSHKLANTVQYLGTLNTLLELDPDATPASAWQGLPSTARDVDELGWTLGILAGAGGSPLLGTRVERAGLVPFLRFVVDAARRDGRTLTLDGNGAPEIVPGAPEVAWRAPWLVGRWIFGAARRAEGPVHARFALDGGVVACVVSGVEAARTADLERELTAWGARFEMRVDARALIAPATWFSASRGGA